MNALRLFPYLVVTLAVTGFPLAAEAALVAPDALNPGATVSPVPNGDSSSPTNLGVALFDDTEPFDFNDGLLAGTLRDRVLQYQNVVSSFHPFGKWALYRFRDKSYVW
jgi:hypothetical protein